MDYEFEYEKNFKECYIEIAEKINKFVPLYEWKKNCIKIIEIFDKLGAQEIYDVNFSKDVYFSENVYDYAERYPLSGKAMKIQTTALVYNTKVTINIYLFTEYYNTNADFTFGKSYIELEINNVKKGVLYSRGWVHELLNKMNIFMLICNKLKNVKSLHFEIDENDFETVQRYPISEYLERKRLYVKQKLQTLKTFYGRRKRNL